MSTILNYEQPAAPEPSTGISTDFLTLAGVSQHVQRMKIAVGESGTYRGDLDYGPAPGTGCLPVVLATDQAALPVTQQGNWTFGLADGARVAVTGVPHVLVDNFPANPTVVGISGLPTVLQGASPWSVSVVNQPVVTLPTGTVVGLTGVFHTIVDSLPSVSVSNFPTNITVVGVSGEPTVIQGGAWSFSLLDGSRVAITGVSHAIIDSLPSVTQGTSPWIMAGEVAVTGVAQVNINNATIAVTQSSSPWATSLNDGARIAVTGSLPAGSNSIGSVSVSNFPTQTTVVGISGSPTVSANLNDYNARVAVTGVVHAIIDSLPAVSVSNFPASVTVVGISGVPTVVANQGANPWSVGGTVAVTGVPHVIIDSIPATTVNQGTSPWVSSLTGGVAVTGSLPAGSNLLGSVSVNGTPSVNANQAGIWTVGISDGLARIAITGVPHVIVDSVPTTAVTGTVTANKGGTWTLDGGVIGVTGVPHVIIDSVPTTTVTGTVTANQGGTWTVGLSDYLAKVAVTGVPHVIVDSAPTTTVTGTVTANKGGTWTLDGGVVAVTGVAQVNINNTSLSVTQGTSPWVIGGASTVAVTGVPHVIVDTMPAISIATVAVTGSLPTGSNTIGTVNVATETVASSNSWGALSSISTSGVRLCNSGSTPSKGLQVKASVNNSAFLYVGMGTGVTAGTSDANDGMELAAGESMLFPINNPTSLYVISTATGQKAFWMVL